MKLGHTLLAKVYLATLVSCALFVFTPVAVQATTIQAVDMPVMVQLSDVIVTGVITGHQEGATREFTTEVTLRVTESFKGPFRVGDELPITVERGGNGTMIREAIGEAHYQVGKRSLVFLEDMDGHWMTLGLGYGKFDVFTGRDGRDMAQRSPEGIDLAGGPAVADSTPVALDDLRPVLRPETNLLQAKTQ